MLARIQLEGRGTRGGPEALERLLARNESHLEGALARRSSWRKEGGVGRGLGRPGPGGGDLALDRISNRRRRCGGAEE